MIIPVESLTVKINSKDDLWVISYSLAKDLPDLFGIDKHSFLFTLCGVESSFGTQNKPRFEPGYSPGARYFTGATVELYKEFGSIACCSYGPWQIMATKARELGYFGHPLSLWDGRVSGPLVVKLIRRIIESGANSVEQVLDSYNTGSFKVGEPPSQYISRFWALYESVIQSKLK